MFRAIVCFVALLCLPAAAQVTTAELVGTVTDASGGVVVGAKVTITNPDTGFSREGVSDASGAYFLPLIPPGNYSLTVEAAGFRKLVQSGITLEVSQRARLDLALQVGQLTEVVEVTAAAPMLQSQSSSLGTVIPETFLKELPMNTRNFVTLAILSPGVNGAGFSTAGTIMSGTRPDDRRPGTELFSNGNREGSNNFLYDGVDNNDRLTLSIVLRPSVEAIKEFKVQTNMFSADLGRNSGAVVDVITKSGTNDLHGSLFEFLRNSAMDAREFFNIKGTPFPAFRYNQFGATLGGPVSLPKLYSGKNRTFFFVDYEGYRRSQLLSRNTTIPVQAMREGNFGGINRVFDPLTTNTTGSVVTRTEFANGIIPASRFDPVTAKLVNAYPQPQFNRLINNYLSNMTQTQRWDQGDVRVDHQFGSKDSFFARWSIQQTETLVPNTFPAVQIAGLANPVTVGNEDSFAGPSFSPVQHAVANWVHIFSPRFINEVRIGFNRFRMDYTAEGDAPGANLGNKLGVPNSNTHPLQNALPIFSPSNFTGVGHTRSLPIFRRENTFQYGDNATYTLGQHTLKFGGDLRRRQITEYQTNRGNGRFNFSPAITDGRGSVVGTTGNSMASFLLGYPSLIEQDFTLVWTGQRGIEQGYYFADDYRVSRKLTLNLGLRWEYYSPYKEVANRIGNFDADSATVKLAGRDGVDERAGVNRDWSNWAPRFGFAYQIRPTTVIRGGYGLFYNPSGNGGSTLRLFRHLPFGPIYSLTPGDVTVVRRVSDGFPAPPTVNFEAAKNPTGGVIGVFPDYKSARVQQYNLTVEHEIAPWQMLFRAAYVGNLGRRLYTTFDPNQPVPGAGSVASRRPFFSRRPDLAGINYAVSDGLSNYNAFQLTVEKRMSRGLLLKGAYTWSHAIDDVGTEFSGGAGTPQDSRNRRSDRSNSSFDMRHRFTAFYGYHLPFGKGWLLGGWQISGIATLQTGLPFNPGLQSNSLNTGGGSRPDRIRDGTLSSSERSLNRWFDFTAFTQHQPGLYGNAGRNILFGPGRVNFDMSLMKNFPIREKAKLQFRAEAPNVFNTPQFGQPNASIGNVSAGVISSTVGTPRCIQLGLRMEF